jgi:enamine deaminase RidA (YjgF/YER057c/UK114 family)
MGSASQVQQRERDMVNRSNLDPVGLKAIPAPVSHGVAVAGLRTVYVSGQVAVDRDGNIVGAGDVMAQTHQVMRNMQAVLAKARVGCGDVVIGVTHRKLV